jgi:hypothetical protein
MAFNRILKLFIYEPLNAQNQLKQTEISDLHLEFLVTRSNTSSENTAEFIIYNANEDTRKKVLKQENNLRFEVGYVDETIGTIYSGNITEVKSILDAGDWITTVSSSTILDQKKALTKIYTPLSYASGVLLSTPLQSIATQMGLVLVGGLNANVPLKNGWTYAGEARGALEYCRKILKANNADLYRDNTQIIVYRTDIPSQFESIVLTYNNGLLRVSELVEDPRKRKNKKKSKRIEFESLIIPKLQPNGKIAITNTDKLDGVYTIEKLVFEGDNFGGENKIIGEAVA